MIEASTMLPWRLDPLEALARWPAHRPVALLHSGRFHRQWSRYSIFAAPTAAYRVLLDADDQAVTQWLDLPESARLNSRDATRRWEYAPQSRQGQALTDVLAPILADHDALWLGYLAYDVARLIETLPRMAAADRHWPLIQFQRCPGWLVYDAENRQWAAGGTWPDSTLPDLPRLPPCPPYPPCREGFHATSPVSDRTRAEHEAAVARAMEYIAAGDIFQVNLAQRFTAEFTGDTRSLFASLAGASPAWYGAYIELLALGGEPRRTLASTSPELFLSLDGRGHVITRPIKGTRPAHVPAAELERSEKDAAELHMIVDLLRNDLGRVCRFGSVQVAEARHIETHPTIHHGVATVRGRLRAGLNIADLLAAAMPGGSITGAPKVRAMQIIEELEPVRRGAYCGAIGYIHRGAACFNIAIRTLLAELAPDQNIGRVDFSVGGGVVADSTPAGEYQETLDKAAALIHALTHV